MSQLFKYSLFLFLFIFLSLFLSVLPSLFLLSVLCDFFIFHFVFYIFCFPFLFLIPFFGHNSFCLCFICLCRPICITFYLFYAFLMYFFPSVLSNVMPSLLVCYLFLFALTERRVFVRLTELVYFLAPRNEGHHDNVYFSKLYPNGSRMYVKTAVLWKSFQKLNRFCEDRACCMPGARPAVS